MKITVDTANLMDYGDGDTALSFQQAVEEKAAAMLLAEVSSSVRDTIRERLWELVQEHVRTTVALLVQKAMEQPIQPSTPWGESKSDPITVLEIVRLELERFLNNKSGGGYRESYDKTPRNLRELVEQLVRECITRELQQELHAARKQVSDAVKNKAIAAAVAALNGK